MGSFASAEDSEQLHTPSISGSLSPKPSAPRIRWPTNGNQSNGTTRQPREAHPKAPPVRSRLSQCGGTDQWRIPSTSGSSPSRLICREFLRPCTEARAVAASLSAKKHPPAHTHTHTCCNSLANTRTSYQWHSEACATPKPNTCVSSDCKRGLCLSGSRHHKFSYCQTQKLKN